MGRREGRYTGTPAEDYEILANVAGRATGLGHLPLRQGRSFECARCGASGTVSISTEIPDARSGSVCTVTVSGTIAEVRCV